MSAEQPPDTLPAQLFDELRQQRKQLSHACAALANCMFFLRHFKTRDAETCGVNEAIAHGEQVIRDVYGPPTLDPETDAAIDAARAEERP